MVQARNLLLVPCYGFRPDVSLMAMSDTDTVAANKANRAPMQHICARRLVLQS